MLAVFKISLTIILFTMLMFVVDRSSLFTDKKKDEKNSESDIFMKRIIGLELVTLIIVLSVLYFRG
ncbi:hypothetical protein [Salinicoccus sp. HZC-1]|uniref:hypothetical protein n=1 Tax=Salinicoccus sp. HZC-1 TaxID=3385497 RepID=UPI00398B6A5D